MVGRGCRDRVVAISALDTKLCDTVCMCLTTGRWFSPRTPVSATNETPRNITEKSLKIALNTITLTIPLVHFVRHISLIYCLIEITHKPTNKDIKRNIPFVC